MNIYGQWKEVALYHVMADYIRTCGTLMHTQKNLKQVYQAHIIVNGKFRPMKARFLPNGKVDDSFGDYGVQKVC